MLVNLVDVVIAGKKGGRLTKVSNSINVCMASDEDSFVGRSDL